MMMKSVLCGLKPICAKHRVATSGEMGKTERDLWEIEGKSRERQRKCQIKVAMKFSPSGLKKRTTAKSRIA